MNGVIQLSFWLCTGGVFYAYIGYPIVLFLLSRVFGRQSECEPMSEADLPRLSVLIAAHNEEDVIRERILNALALDYPRGRFEIVLASDGSTDRTAEIVRSFGDEVRLLDFTTRRGKSATLNRAMRELAGEVVLLSDANTSIKPSAGRKLVRWFASPDVGAVCGRLVIVDPVSGANADGIYWKYETFLKQCENRLGALLGSNGAIYAIRRELLEPIPEETIVDDFVISLRAKLRTGCTLVYDRDAVGTEEAAPNVRDEFRRRVRIGAGGFQAIAMLWPLLSPRFGWTAFAFFSHKILRWLCPMFMIGSLLTAAFLATELRLFQALLIAQLAFYTLATLPLCFPRVPRTLRIASMFVSMNVALLLGFVRFVRGSQRGVWQRTQRTAST